MTVNDSIEAILEPPVEAESIAPAVSTSSLPAAVTDSTDTGWPLGVSRPPLDLADLPTPEQVFNLRRLGIEELILVVLGPGLIALGLSFGSGEWILGPLNVSQYGMRGIFWVALVSIVLQIFYNVELGRYTLATGEPPIVGFGRTPPGYWFWVPVALLSFYAAFMLGSWATSAGSSLFMLVADREPTAADLELSRLIGIALMLTVMGVLVVGRKIERTMEALQGLFLPYIFVGLFMLTVAIVPAGYIGQSIQALLVPSMPPAGADITLLGALAGFAALASGLNFMFIGYYRDKGYGMGSYTGYIPTLVNRTPGKVRPVGMTFPESEINTRRWKRWFRILLVDQWLVYFPGVLLGILLPSVLFSYIISNAGPVNFTQDAFIYTAATLIGQRYGQLVSGWILIVGFAIMYTTQVVVLELLARNLTDGLYGTSRRFRAWVGSDPRKFYFPALLVIIAIVSIAMHLNAPTELSLLSANLSNFAAMLFPLALIYLNRRLPRPARIGRWSVLALILNIIFFGFFFINFLAVQITGVPLVRF